MFLRREIDFACESVSAHRIRRRATRQSGLPNRSQFVLTYRWNLNDSPPSSSPPQLGRAWVQLSATPAFVREPLMPWRRRSSRGCTSRSGTRITTSWLCRCDVSADTRLDSLSHLVPHKANLRVQCRTCDKVSIIDASRFRRHHLLRRWNAYLEQLGYRLPCSRCGAKNSYLKATSERAGPDPFPTSEQGWTQLYGRLRD